ncbi:pyrroline-5-carboxylate reductase [Cytobacillus eiseniae]|uniref:Pyrroline-5-carboxylate reductase n=1 Tax=Cytobacillus eiseniae TaxID=762947 RepID=A0ABS4RH20_9BACI|nr:pyrroline-5-carboxylate reductase [Cytobacillus eiseniae]MBP2242195.1 pyrroline-5-carboxylate reductase [Cytobacillus eiseniae]
MERTIGFIGCGKMAQAIIGGILQSADYTNEQLIASAKSQETISKVKETLQIQATSDNKQVAKRADILFLAVKPAIHAAIIEEIKHSVKEDAIIITIAAGISLTFLEQSFGKEIKAVRTMPNTPSLVGEGMSAICANSSVTEADMIDIIRVFSCFGKVEVIDEGLMNAIPAISGSSPAYVYMMIEALADGGVKAGLTRNQSYQLAAQAVLGAAKMILETGKHPGELKDEVCTPGGATIEAVAELEKRGFRASILSAMERCTEKTMALSNEN